jgi:dsRNA-specific ribonuclease
MLKQYSKIEEKDPGKFPARRLLMSWNRSSAQGGKWGSTKRRCQSSKCSYLKWTCQVLKLEDHDCLI